MEPIAASLRKYGCDGQDRHAEVARWLEVQGEDTNIPDAGARTTEREQRPRQEAFHRVLLRAYEGRCAITGCDVEPALEAVHVADWRSENDACAGILLRADLHRLLDDDLLVIDGDYTVIATPPWYRELQDVRLRLPKHRRLWPRLQSASGGNPDCSQTRCESHTLDAIKRTYHQLQQRKSAPVAASAECE